MTELRTAGQLAFGIRSVFCRPAGEKSPHSRPSRKAVAPRCPERSCSRYGQVRLRSVAGLRLYEFGSCQLAGWREPRNTGNYPHLSGPVGQAFLDFMAQLGTGKIASPIRIHFAILGGPLQCSPTRLALPPASSPLQALDCNRTFPEASSLHFASHSTMFWRGPKSGGDWGNKSHSNT